MRVMTIINRQPVIALIDSGSTHNFINAKTANKLSLKITAAQPFNVRVADGFPLRCQGAYRKVAMDVGGATFTVDLFSLPLTGLDVVLGMSWLEMLGPTMCDWRAKSLMFTWEGEQKSVHGLKNGLIKQAHSEELSKEIRMGQTLFALSIHEEK